MFGKPKSPLYHAKPKENSAWGIEYATNEELQQWADDQNCIEKEQCVQILEARRVKYEKERLELLQRQAARREELQNYPFDPRTEVSADAQHVAGRIVKTLWVIFIILPFVGAIVSAIVIAMFK